MGRYEEIMKRTEDFRRDRFGMFIHWGLYSVRGKHEWTKSHDRLTDKQYAKYFDAFTAEGYDPAEWAKIAVDAGMKYAVLTTKHHEGFCLFDSKYTDYKATNSPAKRDLVKEYVEAFRAAGLKVGFYYSLLDWHHEDYPHFSDSHHPMRGNPDYTDEKRDFSRYVEYMHNQVRELCTNYGKIDIMWFDFSYGNMSGEKWQASKLVNLVRSLQPDIIIDNRLVCEKTKDPDDEPFYAGDFRSPEQFIPSEGLKDSAGRPLPWEACLTTQYDSWGYRADNEDFITSGAAVRTLVDCVSKGGNLLLNVGPDGKGRIPDKAAAVLKEVGRWMKDNSESVYGCFDAGLGVPEWGRYTTDGKYLYAHIFEKTGFCTTLKGIKRDETDYALRLKDNTEVPLNTFWNQDAATEDISLSFPRATLPDEKDTVIKIVPLKK